MIGSIVAASFVTLVLLQSSNLWKDFTIESSSDLMLLYALSGLNFAALIIFGFIFLRSIIKLVKERRTLTLGAQIKTRLMMYFIALSLLPIIAMAFFSYLFMNRALDRWFTNIPERVLNETQEMQRRNLMDRTAKLDEATRMLAIAFEEEQPDNARLESVAAAGNLVHLSVDDGKGKTLAAYERPVTEEERPELDRVLAFIRNGRVAEPELRDGRGFDVSVATMSGGRVLQVIPDPFGERAFSQVVANSVRQFEDLKDRQVTIRRIGLLTLGVLTFLLMFAASWIAIHVARGLTTPIRALAEGADEIARGNLSHRVDVPAEDELSLLVTTFNEMSSELEANSIELGERRRYIETVLETLPTGVISFDSDGRISTINGAAKTILRTESAGNGELADLVSEEDRPVFDRLIARARRVGNASDQTTIHPVKTNGDGPESTVALTAAALPNDGGIVLVIEDLSELIAAQRASAWQEVARRMAHEIKNPLTPIQLSAERIAKRFAGQSGENGAKRAEENVQLSGVVSESTTTILREVASLKMMVDEFAKFARLPQTQLEERDLNEVVRQAVGGFDGRADQPSIELELADKLPAVLIDEEQLKRVFVNLIENAVEAFGKANSDEKIVISTRHDAARDIVVAEVTDNGPGIAPSDLQKLFQPYFSTKGRGTGLGLAIVNRIVTEHNGKIKVVANQPRGAKFILELPVSG